MYITRGDRPPALYGSYDDIDCDKFGCTNNINDKKNMKNKGINKLLIHGKSILIDYDKENVVFPEDIEQYEIDDISYYLIEEGFIDTVQRDSTKKKETRKEAQNEDH